MKIYRSESAKPVDRFVKDLGGIAKSRGFLIHNEDKMELSHVFGRHGVEVADDFDLHMIQICKPEKAAISLSQNPERSVLMPKFIMTFSRDGPRSVSFTIRKRRSGTWWTTTNFQSHWLKPSRRSSP